ncbi:unnamed protein product [Schistosoma spindalis]|nr:unnamed protein product [Schistosoma spindale]
MSKSSNDLLVIGAGLPRTGTKSLKNALEILYHKPCYHMTEIITKQHNDIEKWQQLFDEALKNKPNEIIINQGLKDILNDYGTVTDAPACGFYQELMKIYPNAKVILTIRDKNDWLSSFRQTLMPKSNDPSNRTIDEADQISKLGPKFIKMAIDSMKLAFRKIDFDIDNDEEMLICYDEYNRIVKETVQPERLLIHNLGDGWEPLCRFLNVDIPEGISYPHINVRK